MYTYLGCYPGNTGVPVYGERVKGTRYSARVVTSIPRGVTSIEYSSLYANSGGTALDGF